MIAGIGDLWRSAADLGKGWWRRRAALAEVQALDPHERSRIFSETGMGRTDLALALRAPCVSDDLLARSLDTLGVDVDAFYARNIPWHRDMERACALCVARGRCRRDLVTGDFPDRYRHYCLNSDSLVQLAADAAGQARP